MSNQPGQEAMLARLIGDAWQRIDDGDRTWLAEEAERIARLEQGIDEVAAGIWDLPAPTDGPDPEVG